MANQFAKVLPGFMMTTPFFESLGKDFTPVTCSKEEKQQYLSELYLLSGYPAHKFRILRDDLKCTAHVCEVRKYPNGLTYVRFEFYILCSCCSWSTPLYIIATFDNDCKLKNYTVITNHERIQCGVQFKVTKDRYEWTHYDTVQDPTEALSFLNTESTPEVAIEDKKTGDLIAYIYGGMGPNKRGFNIEWYIGTSPWLMAANNLDFKEVETLTTTLVKKGMRAFEDAYPWRQFDFNESANKHGVYFDINEELTRYLILAKRKGDEMTMRTIVAVGVNGKENNDKCEVRMPPGSSTEMQLSMMITALNSGDDLAKRAKLMVYLAVRGTVTESYEELRDYFATGSGVDVDMELSQYWGEKVKEKEGKHYV